jgi:hypothetical protein
MVAKDAPVGTQEFRTRAWQAANAKARELGWIPILLLILKLATSCDPQCVPGVPLGASYLSEQETRRGGRKPSFDKFCLFCVYENTI